MRATAAVLALVLFALPHVQGDSAAAPYEQTDPSGDVNAFFEAPAGIPVSPATASIDLTGLRIQNEDETGFDVVLQVAELQVGRVGPCCITGPAFAGEFQLAGAKPLYQFYANFNGGPSAEPASAFVVDAASARSHFVVCDRHCVDGDLPVVLDDAANTVALHFSKTALLGHGLIRTDGAVTDLPNTLRPGDTLSKLRVTSATSGPIFTPLFDAMPNGGATLPPYTLQSGAANTVIVVDLPNTLGGLALVPGVNQTVPFTITNHAGSKRLLDLDYELQGSAEKIGNYHVSGPTTLTVPAGESRNFTFAIDVKPGAKATDAVRLSLRARSTARPDELGFASALLTPGATLGPISNTLYLHPLDRPNFGEPLDSALCNHAFVFPCGQAFMSPLEQDPDAGAGPTITGNHGFDPTGTSQYFFVALRNPVPSALAFAAKQNVVLELNLRAPVKADGILVDAEIFYGNDADSGSLMNTRTTTSIDTTGTIVRLEAPPELGAKNIMGPGSYIGLVVRLSSFLSPTGEAAYAAGGVELLAKDSKITLPLVELPDALKNVAKASPFQLGVVGDREEFVNPGEARLMNVTLLNQDAASHRADLHATVDREGWSVELFPGAAYDLDASDTVKVALLIHAPKDAKEGDAAKVHLEARDEKGANVTLPLTVTATDGFDFRDDALGFETDADARAKLAAAKGKDTPGFEVTFAALAVLAVGLVRRRKA